LEGEKNVMVIRDLTPFQIYKFYLDFEIVDTNMWSYLSFEQASNMTEHMTNNNTQNEKSSIANPTNVASTS
jgi:hypothetical protein